MAGKHGDKAMVGNAKNDSGRRGRRWRIAAWGAAALLLLLPLVAMQFTDEVNWTVFDFVFAGTLLIGTGIVYELAVRTTHSLAYRAAVGIALAAAFMLIWVNGAVGIIGSENNPANLMYFGVLAVGMIGAILARFAPQGMVRAMVAVALAQALVGVVALVAGLGATGPIWPLDIFGATGFFVVLWLMSAWLFGKATRGEPERHAI